MRWFKRLFSSEKRIDLTVEKKSSSTEDDIEQNGNEFVTTNDASEVLLEIQTEEPPDEQQSEKVIEHDYAELPEYNPLLDLNDYNYPSADLLENYDQYGGEELALELETTKNKILETLKGLRISVTKINATAGPTITLFEIVPAPGVRIAAIKRVKDDIAVALSATHLDIETIPERGTIGIEIANSKRSILGLKQLLSSDQFISSNYCLPLALGKRRDNENLIVDLVSLPHLLVCGSTGQGKSVCIDTIINSLLFKKHPSQLKLVLINPNGTQLNAYRHIEKHFLAKLPGFFDAVVTETRNVIATLNSLRIEMDNRYDLLKDAAARSIQEYNEKFAARKLNPKKGHQYLPFIVLVFDAFQEPEITAVHDVAMPLTRLVNLGRQIGIHIVIATERPTSKILPADIAANCTVRIAFKVPSSRDSNIILGSAGAENLVGNGDMLISYYGQLIHAQGAYIDTQEVQRVVDFISDLPGYPQAFILPEYIDEKN